MAILKDINIHLFFGFFVIQTYKIFNIILDHFTFKPKQGHMVVNDFDVLL